MEIKEKLSEIFKELDGIAAIYFFGSQLKGQTDKFSDFDFAVLFQDGWEEGSRRDIVSDLLCKVFSVVGQDKADVVDLAEQPLWFQHVVVQTGKVIYESDKERRVIYEKELNRRCLETGLNELENGRMRKQDVRINLETIEENLRMLETLGHFNYDEFKSEFWYLQSAVRLLQTSIEALVDISRYVIRSLGLQPAEEYSQVLMVLAESGYIELKDADVYARMAKFRNLVVHHYYRVNPEEVYRILKEELGDIRRWRDRLVEIIES